MIVHWNDWTDAVALGVSSVPDDALARAAAILRGVDFVLTAGNGGSAAIASHAAQAIAKPDYRAGGGRPAVCLTDLVPILTAHANDGGWEGALAEAARPHVDAGQCALLVVSSSGRSENVVRLAQLFVDRGMSVVALTGFDGGALRPLATVSLHVDSSDYEVVEPVHDALLHRMQYHFRRLGEKE